MSLFSQSDQKRRSSKTASEKGCFTMPASTVLLSVPSNLIDSRRSCLASDQNTLSSSSSTARPLGQPSRSDTKLVRFLPSMLIIPTFFESLSQSVKQPRAVALHHKRFLVLFTDWDKDSKKVGMINMDGKNLTSLVSERLGWPNGLAVDEELDRVFWSDARQDLLESIKLDGTDRRTVLAGIVKHPFSLAVFEDRLYWSDWENKDIVSCNKFTGKDMKVHVKEVGVQPFGITVTNPVLAKSYISACAHQPCSHICLPSSATSYTCLCPAHLSLMQNKRSCSESLKSTLLVSSSRAIFKAHPHSIGKSNFPTT